MVGKSEPEYYIQLCAQKYAQITENIAASSSAGEIAEMKHKLAIIKEAALEEAKAERRCRMWKLPEFLKVIVDRGGALEKSIPRADALSLIDFFAVPPMGTLGLLSSSQLDHLADMCEGWACTPNLRDYEAARLNGMAIGLRRLAEYLGPLHRPHEPTKSLHGLTERDASD
ncbi:hypothetical protein [Bradyrhizobium arachidis]|uniref:Uncharacterized protein n=1 Tax=Bradyrhizobium arachidis TaxID=858423 RepID=A0AAE7NNT3_9BRAD|nr:hypothetical protein [Bradyrhizobium arachidis]QOZ69329.1 hypothetical protein WN72_25700 [Bradyrhizobium arachidis]SFV19867.1 hypothetical protein SAMN05192541_1708 [Bradyrhizobium arachidis]